MKVTSWKQVIIYLVIIAAVYLFYNLTESGGSLLGCAPAETSMQSTPAQSTGTPAGTSTSTGASVNTGTINVTDLPPEARTTLSLIKSGGPFPYSKDDTVFSNYEGLLPKQSSGYYHEYTVVTPGSPDRGARRIVAGTKGEYYYTSDHYRSFKLIKE